jgi:purine nucleosidase
MSTATPVPLILDMDFGIDDSMATLYLVGSGRAEIVAVGTVHGNTSADQAARNARQILSVMGLEAVPVARGEARPWNQEVHYAAAVHGDDGVGGVASIDEPSGTIVDESAAEQIVRLARERPGELVLLATGPLSNVGRAFELEPRLDTLLRAIVVMGGAVAVPGNMTPHAEANIRHDPEAADRVFSAARNLILVPLDITMSCRITDLEMRRIDRAPSSPATDLVRAMLPQYLDFNARDLGVPGFPLHDPTAAVLALDPLAADYLEASVQVEVDGTLTRGMTCVDRRPAPVGSDRPTVRIAMQARGPLVEEFVRTAFERPVGGG